MNETSSGTGAGVVARHDLMSRAQSGPGPSVTYAPIVQPWGERFVARQQRDQRGADLLNARRRITALRERLRSYEVLVGSLTAIMQEYGQRHRADLVAMAARADVLMREAAQTIDGLIAERDRARDALAALESEFARFRDEHSRFVVHHTDDERGSYIEVRP